ncbi:MAG: pyridoxal-phosphate dependent enzyme [Halobacteria archaeon]
MDVICDVCGSELSDPDKAICSCGGYLEPQSPVLKHAVSMNEGGTPEVDCGGFADELGVSGLIVKNEAANPTGSFYDRGMARVFSRLIDEDDVEGVRISSPGASAVSAAAYGGRAGVSVEAAVPARSSFDAKAYVNVHGGEMSVVRGKMDAAEERLEDLGGADISPVKRPEFVAGGTEIGRELNEEGVDHVFCPAGGGVLPYCLHHGLDDELVLHVVQPERCCPLARFFSDGVYEAVEEPDTVVGELEYPEPTVPERALARMDKQRTVEGTVVADGDSLDVGIEVMQEAGVPLSPAGAVAFAAAFSSELTQEPKVAVVNPAAALGYGDVFRNRLMLYE